MSRDMSRDMSGNDSSADHIAKGWAAYRDRSLDGATQTQLRLMKVAFATGYVHALKVVTATGMRLDDALVEAATREVDEYTRSGE